MYLEKKSYKIRSFQKRSFFSKNEQELTKRVCTPLTQNSKILALATVV